MTGNGRITNTGWPRNIQNLDEDLASPRQLYVDLKKAIQILYPGEKFVQIDFDQPPEKANGACRSTPKLDLIMNTHDKQDCEATIRRIDALLSSGIFEQKNSGNALVQSAFIELMICLRDLLHKTEKYAQRIDFVDDILVNAYVKDATDAITAVRDAACHINSFKQLFDDNGNRGSFNVAYGKCSFMKIGDLELKSEYEDDFAVFYGANRLYFRRTILRAFHEAATRLQPLLRHR